MQTINCAREAQANARTKEDAPAIDRGAEGEQQHCADDRGDGKAFATLRARAALAGFSLIDLADGGYLLSRWNCARHLPCLRCVGDLLRRIGGRQ